MVGMKRSSLGVVSVILILLAAACSRETRSSIATRVLPAVGTVAAESGIVLQTAAVEAAQTNAPRAQTVAAQAVRTGGPIAGTLAADSIDLAGTMGAEIMTTGRPLAGTVIYLGIRAVETRQAAEPFYQCPQVTYTVDTDLNSTADISGEQMAAALAATAPGTPLTAYGDAFVRAARAHGINAYYVAAHAAYDSSWGFNDVATRKNNLFGYGATVACSYDCAVPFASQADSIEFVTQLVKADYLTPGGRFYTTGTLAGMESIYNDNPNWAEGVAGVMVLLRQNTPCP